MEHISPLLQALIDNIGESAAVVILGALALFSTKIQTWWKDRSSKRFEHGINRSVKVREFLAELRVLYKADQAELWQLHNGEYYMSGASIMKCSLTHYVTRTGIANPMPMKDIPTTHMLQTIKDLQDMPSSRYLHGESPDDSFQDAIFSATGTSVTLASASRDLRKNWMGILCVSWINDPGTVSHDELVSYAQQIGELISKKP